MYEMEQNFEIRNTIGNKGIFEYGVDKISHIRCYYQDLKVCKYFLVTYRRISKREFGNTFIYM